MLKFTVKVGLTGGAVYYLAYQGVWRHSEESNKLYGKMYNAASPYLDMVEKQLPFKIPNLPSSNQTSYVIKESWNKGVLATFQYLGDLPEHVNGWIDTGVSKAKENPEIKNFFDSLSLSSAKPEAVTTEKPANASENK